MSERQLRNALPELLTRELLRQGAMRSDLPALCPDSNLLTAYVERHLDAAEQAIIAQHLTRCGDCRRTVMLAVRAGVCPAPGRAAGTLLGARPAAARLLPWPVISGIAAAVLVAAVVFWRPGAPRRIEQAQLQARLSVPVNSAAVMPGGRSKAALPALRTAPAPARVAMATVVPPARPATPAGTITTTAMSSSRTEVAAVHPPVVVGQGFITLNPPPRRPASMVPVSSEPEPVSPQPMSGATAVAVAEPMMAAPPAAASSEPVGAPESGMASAFAGSNQTVSSLPVAVPSLTSAAQNGERNSSMMKSIEDGLGFSKFLPHEHPAAVWRISAQGNLQRAAGKGIWVPVRIHSGARLFAVTEQGTGLWAGGENGLLFHSTNGGQSWRALRLNANGQLLQESIVGIHFRDARQGELTTSSGNRWLTLDGGQLWHLVGKVPLLLHGPSPRQ